MYMYNVIIVLKDYHSYMHVHCTSAETLWCAAIRLWNRLQTVGPCIIWQCVHIVSQQICKLDTHNII